MACGCCLDAIIIQYKNLAQRYSGSPFFRLGVRTISVYGPFSTRTTACHPPAEQSSGRTRVMMGVLFWGRVDDLDGSMNN